MASKRTSCSIMVGKGKNKRPCIGDQFNAQFIIEVGDVNYRVCGTHHKMATDGRLDKLTFDADKAIVREVNMQDGPAGAREALATAVQEALKTKEVNMKTMVHIVGHTILPNEKQVQDLIGQILRSMAEDIGYQNVEAVTGGAWGADRQGALAAYKSNILFHIIVPVGYEEVFIAKYRASNGRWLFHTNARRRMEKFTAMLERAASVKRVGPETGKFTRGMNFVRNIRCIEATNTSIFVSTTDPREVVQQEEISGGTAHAIRETFKRPARRVYWINPDLPNGWVVIDNFGKEV